MVQNPERPARASRARRSPGSSRGGSDPSQAPDRGAGSKRSLTGGRIALSAVLLAMATGLGFAAWRETAPRAAAQQSYGVADIGGPFQLVDQNGRPVDQRVLLGKWSAVFFGYTYCPDTCPATLQALAAAESHLTPAQQKAFQVVFVSVDPARDTPTQMKLYLSSEAFPKGAVGLTGTPAEVSAIAKAYHVIYAKQGTGSDYAVQHSAAIYLMNPQGQFVQPLDESQPPAGLAGQIRSAMTA